LQYLLKAGTGGLGRRPFVLQHSAAEPPVNPGGDTATGRITPWQSLSNL
jgi:hypothetical protein